MNNIPSEYRTASIGPDHAMILPLAANPSAGRNFRKGHPVIVQLREQVKAARDVFGMAVTLHEV
jgi:hypothetical protein